MHTSDVVVVDAGPTGLMLANELALAGAEVSVLERRPGEPKITRVFAVHARTLELFDARGLAEDVLRRGIPELMVPQSGTEQVLQAHTEGLGVETQRGVVVVGVERDEDGVTIALADGQTLRAGYLVGCDGAHSAVRKSLGVDFVGEQYQNAYPVGRRAPLASARPADLRPGQCAECGDRKPFGDNLFRALTWDRSREQAPLDEPVTLDEMRNAFGRIAGEDLGMSDMRWSSRFLSERRRAGHYRVGRLFLASDAAHVHSPLGGQGMNTGIGDAMNLGWKLGAAARGAAPPGLLDSYEQECHPVGEQVLAFTDAFNRLVFDHNLARKALQQLIVRAIKDFGVAGDCWPNESAGSASTTVGTPAMNIAWWVAECRMWTAQAPGSTNCCAVRGLCLLQRLIWTA